MPASPVSLLFTDLYELTMSAVYHARQMSETATFSLFARDLPQRNFYVAAGLEDALEALENFRFSLGDLDYLKTTGLFEPGFLSSLEDCHFSGSVLALPEGTIFFPNEPILEVTAPIIEAQLVETFLLNTIGFQSMIATKAARCVYASKGRGVVDFSIRRTPGRDAVTKVPRSVYIAGFDGTSSVLA
ncbi:MAG: nicotinate phosphoribosyltransferase, partial [Deltaproteobacteria bacterium]|nr:nicotinate phosphoribosyltransferase [Deltaproteobacteria bacterium]